MKIFQYFLLLTLNFLLAANVASHEARPVFIQINETAPGQFTAHWKVPASIPAFAVPDLKLPDTCQAQKDVIRVRYPDAYIGQQQYLCPAGLSGQTVAIKFPILNPSVTSLFRLELLNGETHSHILQPGEEYWLVPEQENVREVAKEYLLLGIQHIFAGIDHLLFVACLIFIARTGRRILVTITGFTLAHSLTLALSTLRIIELPVPPVEAAIALSIVFLAHEISVNNRSSWTWRYPVTVSCSFGMLHGFGFAAVLRAIGLPQTELPAALLFFNLGVETGQIIFICVVAFVFRAVVRMRIAQVFSRHENLIAKMTVYVIGTVAGFWFVERVMGFWI